MSSFSFWLNPLFLHLSSFFFSAGLYLHYSIIGTTSRCFCYWCLYISEKITAPARSEAPPHGICCHLHQMEITVLIRIKHLSRKRSFLVKVPFSRFSFTFSPNPGRWLLCVAEFPGIPSCYLYEIIKVQVRAFSFWRINPSPIKLGRNALGTKQPDRTVSIISFHLRYFAIMAIPTL